MYHQPYKYRNKSRKVSLVRNLEIYSSTHSVKMPFIVYLLHIDKVIIRMFYYIFFSRKRLERELAVKHFQEQNGDTYLY